MFKKSKCLRILVITCIIALTMNSSAMCNIAFAAVTDGSSGTNSVSAENDQNSDDSDDEIDSSETDLDALGFDTDQLPDDYDADADDNPTGSNYTTLNHFEEIMSVNGNQNATLYGHENDLDDSYDTFVDSSEGKSGIKTADNTVYDSAEGCFDGKGRKNGMAYVSLSDMGDANYQVAFSVYSSKTDSSSDPIVLKTFKRESGSPLLDTIVMQSMVEISAGDYDGDDVDEIAVLIPQLDTSDRSAQIVFYDNSTGKVDFTNSSDWKAVWSQTLPAANWYWNNVDLCSGDVNNDGMDDIIVSYGQSLTLTNNNSILSEGNTKASTSMVLYGDNTGNMLRKVEKLSLGDNPVCRAAFAIGDINDDDKNEVIMGGQVIADAIQGNYSRCLGYYNYDANIKKLNLVNCQNFQVAEGAIDNGNWVPAEGKVYKSLPIMKANIDICKINGASGDPCVYIDSALFKFNNGFAKVGTLYEGGEVLSADKPYYEYNAFSSNYAGGMAQGIVLERVQLYDDHSKYESKLLYSHNVKELNSGSVIAKTINQKNNITGRFCSGGAFTGVCDTDNDSGVMRYTGNHAFAYSSPKVLAVLASAPYFEDVANNAEDGEDIKAFSSTAWGKTTGSSSSDGHDLSASFGLHLEREGPLWYFCSDTVVAFETSWGDTDSEDFTVTYSTVAGEDCVVFYSIPTALYEYEVQYSAKDEDGNIVQKTRTEVISIPYQPVAQTITMETYNDIQKSSNNLPVLDGTAITSKCGDPASYPSSTKGLKNAKVYNGDWSAPSYSTGGDVSQEIEVGTEHYNEYSMGLEESFVIAHVGGFWKVGVSGSIGFHDTWGTTNSSSTTVSGTVYNMVPDAKGYGYSFSWKLMTYDYDADGYSFPVVSYLTRDVTEPPAVPSDFSQDHENTTDQQVGLKWTYDDSSASYFDIYRVNNYIEGAGNELVGTVSASDYTLRKNKYGEIVYDEDDNPIKEYHFIDEGRSEDTEYVYRIQARRTKVPPKSIISAPITTKTRVSYSPKIDLSETELTLYHDSIETVAADVQADDNFLFKSKLFQWQKYNDNTGLWEDIDGKTSNSLKFVNCSRSDAGDYRCRVNSEIEVPLLHKSYLITSYSKELTVKYMKRSVEFGPITCSEDQAEVTFSVKVTNTDDGAKTQPTGSVIFTLRNDDGYQKVSGKIDPVTNTAKVDFEDLEAGVYELTARYVGSNKTFRDADDPEEFIYLKGVTSEEWLFTKSSYGYAENILASLKYYKVDANGNKSASKEDITNIIDRVDITTEPEGTKSFELSGEENRAYIPKTSAKTALIEVYHGDEKLAEKKVKITKSDITLSLEDITGDSGDQAPVITADMIKVKIDSTGEILSASDLREYCKYLDAPLYYSVDIGLFSSSDDLIGVLLNEYDSYYYNTKELKPGSYFIKPMAGSGRVYDKSLTTYFNIESEGGELLLIGNNYNISAFAEQLNGRDVGTVSLVSPDKIDNVENVKYQGGTKLTFKACPAKNYAVKQWVIKCGEDETIIESTNDTLSYTVQGEASDIEIRAEFIYIASSLSMQILGGGSNSTIECTSGEIDDEDMIPAGRELSFKATADNGYEFVEWRYVKLGGNASVIKGTTNEDKSESTVTITMAESSAIIYAVFQKKSVELSLSDNLQASFINEGRISIDQPEGIEIPITNGKAPVGATVIIRPASGYDVSGEWSVSAEGSGTNTIKTESIEAGKAISFAVPEDATKVNVQAEAVAGKYGLNVSSKDNTADIVVKVNGKETDDYSSIEAGSTLEITAQPHRGYEFAGWTINNKASDIKSNTYTTYVTKTLNVVAGCQAAEEYTVNVSKIGNGDISYIIESPTGRTTDEIELSDDEITVYAGENITFNTKAATDCMLTYVVLNGQREDYTDKSYTIAKISDDNEVKFGFEPSVSHKVSVTNKTEYKLTAENGREIGSEIVIGRGEDYSVVIDGLTDPDDVIVSLGDVVLEGEKLADSKYRYIVNVRQNCNLLIKSAYETPAERYNNIDSVEKLNEYRSRLDSDSTLDGRLTADIDLTGADIYKLGTSYVLNGTFDGNGHTISGGNINTLFPTVGDTGTVKNLTIENVTLGEVNNPYTGIIARENKGRIENCAVRNVTIDATDKTGAGAIAGKNTLGEISFCLATEIAINNGGSASTKTGGIAGVCNENGSKGKISGCYTDGIKLVGTDADIEECYSNTDSNPISTGQAAYNMNKHFKEEVWGFFEDMADYPAPLNSGIKNNGELAAIPYQISFEGYYTEWIAAAEGRTISMLDEDGIEAWDNGTDCYASGSSDVPVSSSMNFIPVTDLKETGYSVAVINGGCTQYYKSIAKAIEVANTVAESEPTLSVIADCALTKSIQFEPGVTVEVISGAHLTVEEGASLTNNTSIEIKQGGEIVNYGNFQNNCDAVLNLGTEDSHGTFTNCGGFKNYGVVSASENLIKCAPHSWSDFAITKQPTQEEKGSKTRICQVCKEENSVEIDYTVNPSEDNVVSLSIVNEPSVKDYDLTVDEDVTFSTDGIMLVATLKDGVEAGVTNMTYSINNQAINDGDRLSDYVSTSGTYVVQVIYGGFVVPFNINITAEETEPQHEHIWSDNYVILKQATCTEEGLKAIVCTTCGEVKDGSETAIQKACHVVGYWKVLEEPTLEKAGKKAIICNQCGEAVAGSEIILPKLTVSPTSIVSLSKGKKSFTVKWNAKQCTGYQIRYSLKSSMRNSKTVTVKSSTATSRKISKLKSKKKYYVQVRAYKTYNGKRYYSTWSTKKRTTTK